MCYENCDIFCDKRCKNIISCGHVCAALCGEECLDICLVCDNSKGSNLVEPSKTLAQHWGSISKDPIVKAKCGHLYTTSYLDNNFKNNLCCFQCGRWIQGIKRFNDETSKY